MGQVNTLKYKPLTKDVVAALFPLRKKKRKAKWLNNIVCESGTVVYGLQTYRFLKKSHDSRDDD